MTLAKQKWLKGFTMVEMVMVIVIIGIMGAVAAPRFFGTSVFQSRGYADQIKATLRYAQKTASAQSHFVCVTFSTSSVTLSYDATAPGGAHATATCPGSSMTSPSGQTPYVVTAPGGITLSGGTSFYFDTMGKPSFATTQRIVVSGHAAPVTVEAETGYVH
jgi:MSHA pilin protein MshC